MNCNCIEVIEDKMKEMIIDERTVIEASMQKAFQFTENGILTKTCSTVSLVLAGRKKKKEVEVNHNYCPICGVKIDKEEDTEPAATPADQSATDKINK